MKYVFIFNPNAGKGNELEAIKREIDCLPQKNDCEILLTEGPMHATKLVEDWCSEHPSEKVRFIACGGDGTINEVFSGAVGKENASVSLYPCGSGNDFVKVFGEKDILKNNYTKFRDLKAILEAEEHPLDVMTAGDRYCINVLNFGFDTMVARTMNELRDKRGHGSKSDYIWGIVKALFTAMRTECKVFVDEELINPEGVILLCTLGNGRFVGGSFKCAPRAKTDDGLIEVCLVKPISRLRFISLVKAYVLGIHLEDPRYKKIMEYRQGKRITIEAKPDFAYSLDGEIVSNNHIDVEILPGALKLAMPE